MAHQSHIKKLFFSNDSKILYSYGNDCNIFIWKLT